jgi:hypothetical protein
MSLMMVCPHCGDETTLSPTLLRQLPAAVRCLSCSNSFESLDCLRFQFSNRAEIKPEKNEISIHAPPNRLYGIVGGGVGQQSIGESFPTSDRLSWPKRFTMFFLTFTLCVMCLFYFRQGLVDFFPQLQIAYASTMSWFGKDGTLPENISMVETEHSEIRYQGGFLEIQTFVRNKDEYAIAWPYIELVLLDKQGKVVLKRILSPREYLAFVEARGLGKDEFFSNKGVKVGQGLLPRQEYLVQMFIHYPLVLGQIFEYQMKLFYPNQ